MRVSIKTAGDHIFAGNDALELMGKPEDIIQVLDAMGKLPEREAEAPSISATKIPHIEWRNPEDRTPETIVHVQNIISEAAGRPQVVEVTDPEPLLRYIRKAGDPLEPNWQEVNREELRVGDVVRVMLGVSDHYEPERRITGEFTTAGYLPAVGIESGIQSPIAPSNIYSSIQVDANRRGPELVTEEPQETFEFEEIEFEDIEKGDYIRSTYSYGVKEGVADHLNTWIELGDDWATGEGEIIAGEDGVGEVPLKIERRVQWEAVTFDQLKAGDEVRVQCHIFTNKSHRGELGERVGAWWENLAGDPAVCDEFNYHLIERKVK